MSDFKKALEYVLKSEGGFVNDPNDHGGATNMGITIGTLSHWLGRPASVAEVKNLTKKMAGEIYKAKYWDVNALDKVEHAGVACAIFDQGVNRGPTTIAKAVQRLLACDPDGHVGPKTLKAINTENPARLIEMMVSEATANYQRIVEGNPSQAKFLKGWLRRAAGLRELAKW